MEIKFSCQYCRRKIASDEEYSGARVECPNCTRPIRIPSARFTSGTELGGYRVEQFLGCGAMGEVYLAEQLSMRRSVGLKVMAPGFGKDPENVDRFRNEVRNLARLNHPNIVSAFEAGEVDGCHFLAMSYVNGESLDEKLDRDGPMAEKEALAVGAKVASALGYAWEDFQLLHRDVKPANIMLDDASNVKLMDMGIAKNMNDDASLTTTGTIIGTPHYMSPEQARAQLDLDARSDIYSLGATLYHLLSGRTAIEGDNLVDVLTRKLNEPVEPLTKTADVSAETSAFVLNLMAIDRDKRPATWDAVQADILALQEGRYQVRSKRGRKKRSRNPTHVALSPTLDAQAPAKKSNKLPIALGAAVLLVLILGLLVASQSPETAPPPPKHTATAGITAPPAIAPTTTPQASRPKPKAKPKKATLTPEERRLRNLRTEIDKAKAFIQANGNERYKSWDRIRSLRPLAKGTEYEKEVNAEIRRTRALLQEEIDEALKSLDRKAKHMPPKKAAAMMRNYEGPHYWMSKEEREARARALEKQAAKVSKAHKEPRKEVKADLKAIYDEAAEALVNLRTATAAEVLQKASAQRKKYKHLKLNAEAVSKLTKVGSIVRESFKQQIGKNVTVSLRDGDQKMEIKSVGKSKFRALVSEKNGYGRYAKDFAYRQLKSGEINKRLQAAKFGDLTLLNGQRKVRAENYAEAKKVFQAVGGPFAEALVAAVDQRATKVNDEQSERAFAKLMEAAELEPDNEPAEALAQIYERNWKKSKVRDLRDRAKALLKRYENSAVVDENRQLITALSVMSSARWPVSQNALEVFWQSHAAREAPRTVSPLTPKGGVMNGHNGELQIIHGGYILETVADDLLRACRKSNELTLEVVIRPLHLKQGGPARIVSFSRNPAIRNFTLGLQHNELMLRLRTTNTNENGLPDVALGTLSVDQAHHVAVSYRSGRLICFINGKRSHHSDQITGSFEGWEAMTLCLGNEATGDRQWRGALDGLCIYSRAMGEKELSSRYTAYKALGQPFPQLPDRAMRKARKNRRF